jgi:DNA polymerase IV
MLYLHMDFDTYFASAERTLDPLLKGRAVVIGNRGDTSIFALENSRSLELKEHTGAFSSFQLYDKFGSKESRNWKQYFVENGRIRGMCVTCSYEARSRGLYTGISIAEALSIVPDVLVVPEHKSYYYDLSNAIAKYLHSQIPTLFQGSVDEFFGNTHGWIEDSEIESFAYELQYQVLQRFDIPMSIGAGTTMTLAKMATSMCKPFGVSVVTKAYQHQFLSPIPIDKFPGIGRRMQKKLGSFMIKTLGDVLSHESLMMKHFGRAGKDIFWLVSGVRDVDPTIYYQKRKSIAIGRTMDALMNRDEVRRRIVVLARNLSFTIYKLGINPTGYYFGIKYDIGGYNKVSFTERRVFSEKLLRELALATFEELDTIKHYGITFITLRCFNFANHKTTYNLLTYKEDREASHLYKTLCEVRECFGIDYMKSGVELMDYLEG